MTSIHLSIFYPSPQCGCMILWKLLQRGTKNPQKLCIVVIRPYMMWLARRTLVCRSSVPTTTSIHPSSSPHAYWMNARLCPHFPPTAAYTPPPNHLLYELRIIIITPPKNKTLSVDTFNICAKRRKMAIWCDHTPIYLIWHTHHPPTRQTVSHPKQHQHHPPTSTSNIVVRIWY